jgi:hypothetical protein
LNRKRSALAAMFAFLIVASSLVALNAAPLRADSQSTLASTKDLIKPVTASDLVNTAEQIPLEVEELRKKIPATFEEANAFIPARRNKYLMWTHDLAHVMWGVYGGGHFVGTDNLGKHAWGIYGNGYFAGFYDEHFFWGKYSNTEWKAQGLFGMRSCYGRYTLAPIPVLTSATP